MASKVIDLTNDESPRKPKSSDLLLYQAIDGTNKETLAAFLKKVCAENSSAKALVESEILASSGQVVPYHADTESEDDEGIEEVEAESGIKEESVSPNVKDDIRRQCARCPEAFTHAENEKMDECVWHTGSNLDFITISSIIHSLTGLLVGTKEVNPDADAWYDYNDEAYGPEEIHIDDPAYAEGFKWSCCEGDGRDGGCQEGKHIAEGEENTEIKSEKDLKKNLKRKAGQAELEKKQSVLVPRYTTCENCSGQFDVTDNYRGACVWHTGNPDFHYMEALILTSL